MKKRRGIQIRINFTNRWLYSLIAIGILALIGVGVYAATYTASGAGHPYTEISTCGANQVLKMDATGTAWACSSPIQDPPGLWTCTMRTNTGGMLVNVVASCVGSEKLIIGGCSSTQLSASPINHPTANPGWSCYQNGGTGSPTITAYAYCCL